MNATRKAIPSEKGQIVLATLKSAVAQALERKRRLGQYAVIWENGKPVAVGEDVPMTRRMGRLWQTLILTGKGHWRQ